MAENLIVVSQLKDWPHQLAGARVVSAQQYLTDASFGAVRPPRVFNLCRSYAYQSAGYYVSLLAEARGHRPQPDVLTIQDMKGPNPLRLEQLEELIQRTLRKISHAEFELSVYFGRTLAERDRQLGKRIFGLFPAPLLRASFRRRDGRWRLKAVRPIPAGEVPETHRADLIQSAEHYFRSRRSAAFGLESSRWTMALLLDPEEEEPPSDDRAIQRFVRAFQQRDFAVELVTNEDFGRMMEFDAVFVRATTSVHHFTFRFARRAAREGIPVIDSPESIARCANKVFLAELLARHGVPTPKTVVVHRDSVADVIPHLGLPLRAQAPRQRLLARRQEGLDARGARGPGQGDARKERVDRRPGVRAERLRLAHRRARRARALGLQVPHGLGALADHPAHRPAYRLRTGRGVPARRRAALGGAAGGPGGSADRRRALRRRRQGDRPPSRW